MKSTLNKALLVFAVGTCGFLRAQNTPADSLKRVLRVARTDTAKANIYNRLASQYTSSHPDSTTFYADQAAALSASGGYEYGAANALINKGNVAIVAGKYKNALAYFAQAQHKFESLADKSPEDKSFKNGLARAYASAGVVYTQQSNHYLAVEQYRKALELYREIGQKVNLSKALNNIGIVYKSKQDYPKALDYFKQALAIQHEIGERNEAVTLTNIGIIEFETRQYDKAIAHYGQAEALFAENGDVNGYGLLSNSLGDYYKSRQDAAGAEQQYRKSLALYESIPNKFGASLAFYRLAQLYADQKKFADALPLAQRSLDYAQSIGVLDQAYHSEQLLSDVYAHLGRPVESLEHYKKYVAARDSITVLENAKKFAQAEMDFEYKQKEALLIEQNKRQTQFTVFSIFGTLLLIGLILVIQNRTQVKRRLTLQKEVAEYEQKALHLQMNPHFVFNCLGAISSFIVQNGTDSALKYLSKFSKLMRLTLEYSKGSLIPIDKEIESLKNYLELEQLRFNNKFDFTIEMSPKVEFNMGLPPLLIQPFVENAILHGMVPKEGNGRIDVFFDVRDNQLVCTVTDDGIGLAQSRNLKENSVTAHQSMALEITKKRLEIMESTTSKSAQIDIEELKAPQNPTGTRVTLRLPVQYIQ